MEGDIIRMSFLSLLGFPESLISGAKKDFRDSVISHQVVVSLYLTHAQRQGSLFRVFRQDAGLGPSAPDTPFFCSPVGIKCLLASVLEPLCTLEIGKGPLWLNQGWPAAY